MDTFVKKLFLNTQNASIQTESLPQTQHTNSQRTKACVELLGVSRSPEKSWPCLRALTLDTRPKDEVTRGLNMKSSYPSSLRCCLRKIDRSASNFIGQPLCFCVLYDLFTKCIGYSEQMCAFYDV